VRGPGQPCVCTPRAAGTCCGGALSGLRIASRSNRAMEALAN
jgi:hypothetical protein